MEAEKRKYHFTEAQEARILLLYSLLPHTKWDLYDILSDLQDQGYDVALSKDRRGKIVANIGPKEAV